MRPPIGSEFRLYFERTLGVGCGVGVVLALPGVLLALLVLFCDLVTAMALSRIRSPVRPRLLCSRNSPTYDAHENVSPTKVCTFW